VTLRVGESASYEVLVPTRTALSGEPFVYVDEFISVREGADPTLHGDEKGRLIATLYDCGATCTKLVSAPFDIHNNKALQPLVEDGKLPRVDNKVLAAGHTLRLTLVLDNDGNAGTVQLFTGGTSNSRLAVTATPA
jgi:hypothetical protein